MRSTTSAVSIPAAALAAALLHAMPATQTTPTAIRAPSETATVFVPNAGQWAPPVRHLVQHGGMTTWLTDTGWTTRVEVADAVPDLRQPWDLSRADAGTRGVVVRTTLVGSSGPAAVVEREPDAARHHFFLGADPRAWRTELGAYRRLVYERVLPGVDLAWRVADGVVHYDLAFAPGADPAAVRLRIDGHDALAVEADGSLAVRTGLGVLRHLAPVAWQDGPGGAARPVACRFVLRSADEVGFAVSGRDAACPLVVDPGLVWSTFFGSSGNDRPGYFNSVDVAPNGDVLMCGRTGNGTAFPWTPGAYRMTLSSAAGWVARFDAAGRLLWSAVIGASGDAALEAVRVLPNGDVAFAGMTAALQWPVTVGAAQPNYGGGVSDGVVGVLDAQGMQLRWSTYVGGSGEDSMRAIAPHGSGSLAVCGYTDSTDFPIAGQPVQPALAPATCTTNTDGAVVVFDAVGQRLAATYLGAGCRDMLYFAHFEGYELVMSGYTDSTNLPVTANAYQQTNGGGSFDGLLVRMPLSLSALSYLSYFGGSGDEDLRIASYGPGQVAFATWTGSPNLPTTPGALQPVRSGGVDCMVGVLDMTLPPAQQLRYLTYLGGTADDGVNGVAVDAGGRIVICGVTYSSNFPTTAGCVQTARLGSVDALVACIDPTPGAAVQLVYSTYAGGAGAATSDFGYAAAVDARGDAVLSFVTDSSGFPVTPGAYAPIWNGGHDAVLMVLDLLPATVSRHGAPSPACHGPFHLTLNSAPVGPNALFEVHAHRAPPQAPGWLLWSAAVGPPTPVLGVDVWLTLPAPVAFWAIADAHGVARFPLAIPVGFSWPFGAFQAVWLGSGACAPWIASDALR
jgi:hypothetical protein